VSVLTKDLVITNVAFGDDSVEIVFLERNDQTETAAIVKTIIIDCRAHNLLNQVAEVQELLEEIVDAGYVAVRNPPKTIDPRKRIRQGRPSFEVEVEADDEGEE
jgi:hypothetical protein